MIIAKTTMEYLPTSCKTCDIHLESRNFEWNIECPIIKEVINIKETKILRNCPLQREQ